MADFVPKNLTGALFKNNRKDSDNHPDYTGNAVINGQEFWLSAWVKSGNKGKYMSLSLKPKDSPSKPQASARAAPQRSYAEEMDDEIPF